jgi:hypothetical protein
MGHQERFPPPGLTDRYEFREETIAGTHRNERDAPIAVIGLNPPGSASRHSCTELMWWTAQRGIIVPT